MRLNMTQQGGLVDEFVSGGGNVLNPLILAGDPVQPNEAATKQYVDNQLLSLNANNLIGGNISANRLPAMNGDLVSSSGSGNLILSNTGVTAGTYPKVSVDNKGRVTNGLSLIESDIPSLSWNKFTSDLPSTISGYGITDALSTTGGTMTGQLSITGTPANANQLVNKNYLDSVVGGTTGIAIGDIITKIDPSTPVGFLKCNGAELDKSVYSDLYNAIGDRYTLITKAGNGQPWRQQYQLNMESSGDITGWVTYQSLPGILSGGATFVTKNRVYVYGGYNGSSQVGVGYTAQINNDGTLGAWSSAATLPTAYSYSQAIVVKNKVYLIAGFINNTTATNTVYVADINADGTIGSWGNGPNLPTALAYSCVFINKNRIYTVGGTGGSTHVNYVYSIDIKEDGSLGTWVTEQTLPVTIYATSCVCIKDRVYILGGLVAGATSGTIYSATLNSDGSIGTWTVYGSLPFTVCYHQAASTRNYVYILGGYQNGAYSASIYKAPINADGTLGAWQLLPISLPGTLYYSNITFTKDHIFTLGGYNSGTVSALCWGANIGGGLNDYSSFYSNEVELNYMLAGSGKPWNQQYQINTTQSGDITGWITDSSVLPTTLSNVGVAITKNRVYIFGGFITGTTYSSTIYTTPINSDGTIGAWTTHSQSLPTPMGGIEVITSGNRIYLIGGSISTVAYNTVLSFAINADGTLGTMTTEPTFPVNIQSTSAFITRNRLYVIGGNNGTTNLSSVYFATIFVDGTLGAWSTGTALPVTNRQAATIITKNAVYLIGGINNSGSLTNTIYMATINSDGFLGTWKSVGTFVAPIMGECFFTTKNTAYIVYDVNVYSAPINSDGIIGTWTAGTTLPNARNAAKAIIVNGRVYILGGYVNTTTTLSSILSAPINGGLNDYSSYYAADTINYLMPGSGKPWCQQYQINNTQVSDITDWVIDAPMPATFGNGQAVITKNRVYIIGGGGNSIAYPNVYTAPINSDGSLGTWVTDTPLPIALNGPAVITFKNKIYLIGGGTGSSVSSAIYSAFINSDGTIGTWTASGNLPIAIQIYSSIIIKNRVYLLGGHNGTSVVSTVYTAPINVDGGLGAWTTVNNLPAAVTYAQAVVTKNRVYLLGGYNGTNSLSTVYTALISPDGTLGTWITDTPLPIAIHGHQVFVTKNKVYLLGGGQGPGSVPISNVYSANINADGTLDTWTTGTSLPGPLVWSAAFATKNHIFLATGSLYINSVYSMTNTVYKATIAEGMNDYSSYYNGNITPIEQFVTTAKFKLPDSSFVNDGLNYFIKF